MKCSEIKVIKKDGTKEEFNVQKVLAAVNKSANRAMIIFSKAESKFICEFVEEKAEELDQSEVPIAQMHNIVEGRPGARQSGGRKELPRLPQLQAGFRPDVGRGLQKEPVHHVYWRQGKQQHQDSSPGLHEAEPDLQRVK